MSYGSSGGARGLPPRAPEKGVFPLDHFGECKAMKEEYVTCLRQNEQQTEPCRDVCRAYLECRMSKELMAAEDLSKLGFRPLGAAAAAAGGDAAGGPAGASAGAGAGAGPEAALAGGPEPWRARETSGFIAGLPHGRGST